MDKENVVPLRNGEKKNNIMMKFADKWMKVEKNHPKLCNSDLERQVEYVLTHK